MSFLQIVYQSGSRCQATLHTDCRGSDRHDMAWVLSISFFLLLPFLSNPYLPKLSLCKLHRLHVLLVRLHTKLHPAPKPKVTITSPDKSVYVTQRSNRTSNRQKKGLEKPIKMFNMFGSLMTLFRPNPIFRILQLEPNTNLTQTQFLNIWKWLMSLYPSYHFSLDALCSYLKGQRHADSQALMENMVPLNHHDVDLSGTVKA